MQSAFINHEFLFVNSFTCSNVFVTTESTPVARSWPFATCAHSGEKFESCDALVPLQGQTRKYFSCVIFLSDKCPFYDLFVAISFAIFAFVGDFSVYNDSQA